ncbi:copper homeostasis protein CutC [Pelomyxa schiedti]|nr:copper homeostasis protein CutC [Pelomyxa schiedti]
MLLHAHRAGLGVEVCVDNGGAATAACQLGGIDRVELSGGDVALTGGSTPSLSLVSRVVRHCAQSHNPRRGATPAVHVLLRPRTGDFCYDAAEVDEMADDAARCLDAGADGVVVGALTPDGRVDADACAKLVAEARRRRPRQTASVTFHRAFDFVVDQDQALEDLVSLGFDRILTTGSAKNASSGVAQLAHLVQQSRGRIEIMACGGINSSNVVAVASSGVHSVHLSACKWVRGPCSKSIEEAATSRGLSVSTSNAVLGQNVGDEFSQRVFDKEKVVAVFAALDSAGIIHS